MISRKLAAVAALAISITMVPIMHANAGSAPTLPAINNTSLPLKGGDVQANVQKQASIAITQVDVASPLVRTLAGNIQYPSGLSFGFDLAGQLYKDPVDGRIDGSLVDRKGNFDVMRFQIVEDPHHGIFLNASVNQQYTAYLALYLERKGTRDVTFLETPLTTVFSPAVAQAIESSRASLSAAPNEDVLWIERLFLPDHVTSSFIRHPVVVSGDTIHPDTKYSGTHYYQASWNWTGHSFVDNDYIDNWVNINGSSDEQGYFWPSSYYIVEDGTTTIPNTGWEVGGAGPAGIRLGFPSAGIQRIYTETCYGTVENDPSLSISWAFSTAIQNLVTLTLNYTPSGTVNLNPCGKAPNQAEVADMYLSSGTYLRTTSDYFSVVFNANSSGAHGTETNQFDFIYNMYDYLAPNGGYNIGTQDDRWQISVTS